MSTSVWHTVNTEFDLIQAELNQDIDKLAVVQSLHLSADRKLTKRAFYSVGSITIDTAEYNLSLSGIVWQAASTERQLVDAINDPAVTHILITNKIELTCDRAITKSLSYTGGGEILTNGYLLTLTDPNKPGPYTEFGAGASTIIDGDLEITGNLLVDGNAVILGSLTAGSIATDMLYIGDTLTDGSWRMVIVGNNLSVQRRESGSWVTKTNFTPT